MKETAFSKAVRYDSDDDRCAVTVITFYDRKRKKYSYELDMASDNGSTASFFVESPADLVFLADALSEFVEATNLRQLAAND